MFREFVNKEVKFVCLIRLYHYGVLENKIITSNIFLRKVLTSLILVFHITDIGKYSVFLQKLGKTSDAITLTKRIKIVRKMCK
jgi:hypothetical protein